MPTILITDHFDNETDCEQLEVRGIEAAEEDQLDLALSLFNQSIALAPERPDGYNNRAQLYRLKDDLESMYTSSYSCLKHPTSCAIRV